MILAQTIKGYGLGEAGEGKMTAHQAKKLTTDDLKAFRDRFNIPITDDKIEQAPFFRPAEDSAEIQYLKERRAALGGFLPTRRQRGDVLPAPSLERFEVVLKDTGYDSKRLVEAVHSLLGHRIAAGKHGRGQRRALGPPRGSARVEKGREALCGIVQPAWGRPRRRHRRSRSHHRSHVARRTCR